MALIAVLWPGAAHAETPSRRTETVMVEPDTPYHAAISNIIYVNRCVGGCTVAPGGNDSRADTVSFIQSPVVLSQFAGDDETFNLVIDCVREVYLPYDVEIVTEAPSGDHHEAILAGTPGEMGLDPQVGGIAPAACSPLDNAISFSFANAGQDLLTMCWTVAQESAHAFGLPDHVFDCSDPMTYIPGCGTKYFRNESLPCGEFALGDKACRCGRAKQNSHEVLLATFGPGQQPPPPSVEVALPADGDVVTNGFSVYAFATDPRLIDRIELWLNNSKYLELPGHGFNRRDDDYYFAAPGHADGFIEVEAKAYNDLQSVASAGVTVLKGDPCGSDSDCFEFQTCEDGACTYPPATGELGDTCDYDQACISAICVGDSGGERCSTKCTPGDDDTTCPAGFSCVQAGNGGLCWPAGGGCCTITGGHRHGNLPWMALGLFLCALMMVRSGSRRRASGVGDAAQAVRTRR